MKQFVTVASLAMMLACSTAVAQGDQKPKDAERARLNEKRTTEAIKQARAAAAGERGRPIFMELNNVRITQARAAAARGRGGPILIEGTDVRIVLGPRLPAGLGRKDSVGQALADVSRAVDKAQRTQDPKEIRKQLDHAEKSLMKARKELWKRVLREQDKTKPKRRPKPTSKPTTKRTQTDGTRRSASGRERR